MAIRWAVQSGNWSSTATWNGGALPTAADDVYADGKTVDIDQNISVLSLNNSQRTGGTAGGTFTTSQNVTITLSSVLAGTLNVILLTVLAGSVTVIGNVNGSFTTASTPTVVLSSGTTMNVVGNVVGGTRTNARAIEHFTGNATLNITGNVLAGNVGGALAVNVVNCFVTIVGNVSSNPTGGTAVQTSGPSATISVTGDVVSLGGQVAILSTGSSSAVSVVGNMTASSTSGHAVSSSASVNGVTIAGNMTDSPQGAVAIYARLLRVTPTLNSRTVYYDSSAPTGASVVRASLDVAGDHPLPANVRQGTSYAYSQLTGTLVMPAANVVRNGVPVGNTAGTGAVTLTDIASVVGAQIAAGVGT